MTLWSWLLGACMIAGVLAMFAIYRVGSDSTRYEPFLARIERRIELGIAEPAADAAAAARRGSNGLITRNGVAVPGAVCFTPDRRPPEVASTISTGDYLQERDGALLRYAAVYNRTILSLPSYRDADLCRGDSPGDSKYSYRQALVGLSARPVTGPPRSLHEAARRGSAAEVRHWLETISVDARDGVQMTPLDWAIARGNRAAAEILLEAGADPWAKGTASAGSDAVYWAAAMGRGVWFDRLSAFPGRPFQSWPDTYVAAAVDGGDRAILARMLAEPHDRLRLALLRSLPATELFEPLLVDDPALADPLLARVTGDFIDNRVDLVRLALAHGASERAKLAALSNAARRSWSAYSVETIGVLLDAGVDPNAHRPVWEALRSYALQRPGDAQWQRCFAIADRLRAAGADLNLPDARGLPGAWRLLFPIGSGARHLDTGVRPELIEALVQRGLDLNLEWEGRRLLPQVEKVAGRDSPMAITLRRLGARS